jgi:caa(3)-type oxidase subunit IV
MSQPSHPPTETHDVVDDPHELEHIQKHIKFYWAIFGALGIFTLLTVGVAQLDFGSHANNFTVGIIIAAIKASLVALFFMHLWGEKKLIYRILAFTVFFAIGLFALSLLAYFDHTHIH